ITQVLRRTTPKPEVASGLGADLALIASAGLELRELAKLVEARGVKASVASRFTDTPWTDVAEIAATSDANVVLARRGWGVAEGLRRVGVPVAPEDAAETLPSLLVAPAGVPTDMAAADLTPVLTVHAGQADSDRDMDETLAGIAAGPTA